MSHPKAKSILISKSIWVSNDNVSPFSDYIERNKKHFETTSTELQIYVNKTKKIIQSGSKATITSPNKTHSFHPFDVTFFHFTLVENSSKNIINLQSAEILESY